jgi:3-oxoacyl-[acyl-carrier-protein] synthase II
VKVAVTGLGLLSPIGNETQSCITSLTGGLSGIKTPGSELLCQMGVPGIAAVDFQHSADTERVVALALSATGRALEQAGFAEHIPVDAGIFVSTSKGGVGSLESALQQREPDSEVNSSIAPSCAGEAIAREVGRALQANTRVAACATGLISVLSAYREVGSGRSSMAIAGASEASLTPFIHSGFMNMGAISPRNEVPLVRPFDQERCGFVLGEGAAVLVLENIDSARLRGAEVLAVISGGAQLCEAYSIAAPAPGGPCQVKSGNLALLGAGLDINDIDALWLHGTGTREGDAAELGAMEQLCKSRRKPIPVIATKGLTGHLLGASGAVELGLAISCLATGLLPGVPGIKKPEQPKNLLLSAKAKYDKSLKRILIFSAGFGGHVAALVVERS